LRGALGIDILIEALILLAVVVLASLIGLAFMLISDLGNRSMMRELASALGGRMAGKWIDDYVVIEGQGVEGRIKLRYGRDYLRRPQEVLRLELVVAPRFRWTIRRKDEPREIISYECLTRIENLGLDFSHLAIAASDEVQAMTDFAQPSKKAAILDFFARSFDLLTATGSMIVAQKDHYRYSDLDPKLLRRQFEALRQLAP
jgi:hypothetical protein